MPNDERNLETMPDGALGLIPLESCKELGLKVDQYLVGWREKRQHQHQRDIDEGLTAGKAVGIMKAMPDKIQNIDRETGQEKQQ